MSGACVIAPDAGAVRAMLASVACETHDFAHRGFDALTGGQAFQSAVTSVLVIYVALVGYRLLFASDGARLADAPKMALMVGAVLALISSWSLFETLVFDVSAKAPAKIAELLSVGDQSRSADPVGRLQVAYDQLRASAEALRNPPPPTPTTTQSVAPRQVASEDPAKAELAGRQHAAAELLDVAAGAVLTAHAGLIAVFGLVIGLLNAVGPVFLVLLLFHQTRGLFEGWVRALIGAALATMAAWVVILVMLDVVEPWLIALAQQRALNDVEPTTAVTASALVLVFSAAQLAAGFAAAVIAFGFRLPASAPIVVRTGAGGASVETEAARLAAVERVSRPDLLADQLRRFDLVFQSRERSVVGVDARPARLAAAPTSAAPVPTSVWDLGRSELRRDRYARAEGVR
jgi:type IV secretion system protein VirB6